MTHLPGVLVLQARGQQAGQIQTLSTAL